MSQPDYSEYSKIEASLDKGNLKQGRTSNGKLLLLGIIALALCSFGPFAILAPVPMCLAFLLYGIKKSALLGGGISFFLLAIGGIFPQMRDGLLIGGIFLMSNIYSFLVYKIIADEVPPMKGVIKFGLMLFTFFAFVLGVLSFLGDVSLLELTESKITEVFSILKGSAEFERIQSSGGEESRALLDFVSDPKKVAKQIFVWLPSFLFISNLLSLWVCLFVVLKNGLAWRHRHPYSFSLRDLLHFRAPDFFVWPLILSLVFILVGEYIIPVEYAQAVGGNFLYCLGVFYFFQGFGVYSSLLDYLKIFGLMRSLFIMLTVFMAWKLLAFVGVLDFWINFRKFLKKENN